MKICLSEEISRKQPTIMAHEQAAICLDSNLHVSMAAKPVPLTVVVPKKHFKRKTTSSDQMDSGKAPQKEKAIFLHFGVLRKRIKLQGEKQFASTPDRRAPSLPPSYAIYEGRVRFFRTTLTPQKIGDSELDHWLQSKHATKQPPPTAELCHND